MACNIERFSFIEKMLSAFYNGGEREEKKASAGTCGAVRIFLEGPSSCGKTSLAMDFAFHLINRGGKDPVEESDHGCAVLFIMPERKKQEFQFPMKCRQCKGSQDTRSSVSSNLSNQKRTRQEDEETFLKNMQNLKKGKEYALSNGIGDSVQQRQWSDHDYPILQQINVKYLKSVSDLIYTLATIHSLPPSERPWGAVIIDDLDLFLHNDSNQESAGNRTNEMMKLMQLLAQAVDACDSLDSSSGRNQERGMALLTCLNTDNFPSTTQYKSMIHNYIPCIATIEKQGRNAHQFSDSSRKGHEIHSYWKLNLDYRSSFMESSGLDSRRTLKENIGAYQIIGSESDESCRVEEDWKEIQWTQHNHTRAQ